MGCPGGCVNGGGQPIQPQYVRDTVDLKAVRAKALYDQDASMTLRKSHESPVVKALYSEWYDGFGGHKAHHDLHTSYVPRKILNNTKKGLPQERKNRERQPLMFINC